MIIAFVTDSIIDFTLNQINKLSKIHTVCIFLPESYVLYKKTNEQIRRFELDFNEAMFQWYDIVIFCSANAWEIILPVMTKVKGVAVIEPDSNHFREISDKTAFQISPKDDVAALISELPKHIHWFDREISIISERLELFGLLTDKFKSSFKKIYGVPLSRNLYRKGKI